MVTFPSIAEIQATPERIAASITTTAGLQFTLRPLTSADSAILGPYFLGLSEETKSLYAPHLFDQATADRLCAAIDYSDTIRLIATLPGQGTPSGQEQVIAYFILQLGIPPGELSRYAGAGISLNPQTGCLVAPSVADKYQSRGVGSPIMRHVFRIARRLGYKQVVLMGGVLICNERAVHFYRKLGFQTAGTFVGDQELGRPSYDMYRELVDRDENIPATSPLLFS